MRNMIVNSLGEVSLSGKFIKQGDEAKALNTDEKAFMNGVHFRQAVNDSRFRVYGITDKGGRQIILVTEFIAFSDDTDAWKQIEETAKESACEIGVMHESEHLDRSKKDGDKEWIEGPDHGRMEKQVEMWCYVNGLDIAAIRERIKFITMKTEVIWRKYGVDVM